MKIIFRTTLFIIFLFTTIYSSNAATITWLGGSAAWNDATQWDTGTIPTLGDDVIIPTGSVKIFSGDSEKATSIVVQSLARLFIYNGAELEISGAIDKNGLHNHGRVLVYGNLAIKNITQTNIVIDARAIVNEGRILTYANSQINIKNIDDIGIDNTAIFSYFRVRGGLSIKFVGNTAIVNQDLFVNYGNIDIEDSGLSSGSLIVNTDEFKNQEGGEIYLNSEIYGGFTNSSDLHNYGSIFIEFATIGLVNLADVYNYTSAYIEVENNPGVGIDNRFGSTITNDGSMISRYSSSGLFNSGTLINNNSLTVWYSNLNSSILNFVDGLIYNYDYIYLNGAGYSDLYNEGGIFNYYGGHFAFNKVIDIASGGSITNFGFLITYGSDSHSITGNLSNYGVIDDNHGQLQSHITNIRVVVAPVSGPMQVGVPFSNVLDVFSLANVGIGDWKVSPTGAVAGTYDELTNKFTPNISAVGLSTLYIVITDLISGNSRIFTLEIDSPILPFTKKGKSATTRINHDSNQNTLTKSEVTIYPNPSSGNIQLKSELFVDNQTQVLVFNSLGQVVQQAQLSTGQYAQSIEFSNHLTNGLYIVKTLHEGQEVDVKRIQLHR